MSFPTGAIQVTGPIGTTSSTDTYATHLDYLGYGGYRAVADITTRNAISAQRRTFGMMVYVQSTGATYVLTSSAAGGGHSTDPTDNLNWILQGGGAAIGSPVSGAAANLLLYTDASGNLTQNAPSGGVAYEFNGTTWHLPTSNPDYLGVILQPTYTDSSTVVMGFSIYIHDGAGVTSYDIPNRQIIDNSSVLSLDGVSRVLCNSAGQGTVNWNEYLLIDSAATLRFDWGGGYVYDSSGLLAADLSQNRTLFDANGEPINYFGRSAMVWQAGDVGSNFNETVLTLDDNNQVLTLSSFGGNLLLLDRANDNYGVGDLAYHGNGGQLYINNGLSSANISFNGNTFLSVNRGTQQYFLGDYFIAQNGTSTLIDDSAQQITEIANSVWQVASAANGNRVAVFSPSAISAVIGDYGHFQFGTFREVADGAQLIQDVTDGVWQVNATSGQGVANIEPLSGIAQFGDYQFNNNGTQFGVNDSGLVVFAQTDGVFQVTDATGNYRLLVVDQSAGVPIVTVGDVDENFNLTRFIIDDTAQVVFAVLQGQFYVTDTSNNQIFIADTTALSVTMNCKGGIWLNGHINTGTLPGGHQPTVSVGSLVGSANDTSGHINGLTGATLIVITFGQVYPKPVIPSGLSTNVAGAAVGVVAAGTNSIQLHLPAGTTDLWYNFTCNP